ncbi:tetratricopeptide repeat protein [Actinomadura sp. WMMB 499]|uniref:AfsR/SARP family transcriptional regulator n=1 Tax=Actinomadura sp. WMMB 499 TaxID=1219491 RepID=UPI0012475DCD|nr:tetratricopeptide repeat protein [Actinomadura sp. WMMB 499]QFG26505.1 tetratricopeptide repeat protein [Actinomadura sp. WMMB 499]
MEFRILGPVRLWAGGDLHPPGWAKERGALALLLLNPGRPVTAQVLIDHLWEDGAPDGARNRLHTHIARLRGRLQGLGADVGIHQESGAYTLAADPEKIDYHRFLALRSQARAIADSGDPEQAIALLRDAAALWRGTPLEDVDGSWAEFHRQMIRDELVDGLLDRLDLELRLGRHAEVVDELNALAARFPGSQRAIELVMLALHRSGRSGDAIRAHDRLRRRLREHVGAAPGPALDELRRGILAGDPALAPPVPPPAAAHPPSALPRDLHTFTGRSAELDRLTALAEHDGRTVPVLTIDGMPGVGKSVLAVHLAHRLADRYPDGRLYLALHAYDSDRAPLTPAAALERLLLMTGAEPMPGPSDDEPLRTRPPEVLATLWRNRMNGRRALLLLDDALDSGQIRPLLPGAPGCLVIVTSRRRLAGLEGTRHLSLGVPDPDDAARLLARASGDRVAPGDPGAADVVRLCGQLPLAVQLAAGRLLHRPSWTAADLAARLTEGRGRLVEIRAEDRDLTAAFRLSYEGLPEPDREAFRLLSLHPGADVPAEDAAVLLGVGRAAAEAAVDTLQDHHLISEPRRGRYRFHDLVREYAEDLARRDDRTVRDAALDRLLDHRVARAAHDARLAGPGALPADAVSPRAREEARRRLGEATGDLLRIARHAAGNGRPRHAARLAAVLGEHLESTGRWADAVRLHDTAVAAWRVLGDDAALARALADVAKVAWRSGENGHALDSAAEGLELARSRGDRPAVAGFLDQIGLVHWHRSEFDVAAGYFEQALAELRALDHPLGLADVLNHLGIIMWHLGRYPEALDRMRDALAIYERAADDRGRRITLNNIGEVELHLGDPGTALAHFLRAAEFGEMSRQHLAAWTNNVANCRRGTGHAAEAIDRYREAMAIYREIGDRRGECDSLNQIGACFADLGREGEALIHHQTALALARTLADRFEQAIALCGMGDVHLRAGRYALALAEYEESLGLARSMAAAHQEARALEGVAEVMARTRGPAAAAPHRRRALDLYEHLGVPEAADLRARLNLDDASEA